ncbi:MAG: hypothetical protein AB7Q17_06115 [Phycisphaerae bacterium]
MGAWNTSLFSDDTAQDVREQYQALLADGLDGVAASERLIADWKDTVDDPDEGPVFWLALAATQHEYGRPVPGVLRRALRVIDQQHGLERWRERGPRLLAARLAVLARLRARLLSPPLREKRVAPRFRDGCEWATGAVIGYRLRSGGRQWMRVLGHESHAHGVSPVVEMLELAGCETPGCSDLASASIRRASAPPELLLRTLASGYVEAAGNPSGALQLVLADAGLVPRPTLNVLGFDPNAIGAVVETVERLRARDAKTLARIRDLVRERNPRLLDDFTQFSLRREYKKSELPAKRVLRLKVSAEPSQPLGDWMVLRWCELDEALRDLFAVE